MDLITINGILALWSILGFTFSLTGFGLSDEEIKSKSKKFIYHFISGPVVLIIDIFDLLKTWLKKE